MQLSRLHLQRTGAQRRHGVGYTAYAGNSCEHKKLLRIGGGLGGPHAGAGEADETSPAARTALSAVIALTLRFLDPENHYLHVSACLDHNLALRIVSGDVLAEALPVCSGQSLCCHGRVCGSHSA
jgi:hypothetical protein